MGAKTPCLSGEALQLSRCRRLLFKQRLKPLYVPQCFVKLTLERTTAAQLKDDVPGGSDNSCGDFQQLQTKRIDSVLLQCFRQYQTPEPVEKIVCQGMDQNAVRIHAGSQMQWTGLVHYSLELGHDRYPLFRFCFDYIMEQRMDTDPIPIAQEKLKAFRLYDQSKTFNDPMLQTLSGYYLHTELEVQVAVKEITHRLGDPEDISFYDYGRIAVALIVVKYNLCIDIEEAKKRLISNLTGRGDVLKEEDLFWYTLGDVPDDAQKEYELLRDDMISALNDSRDFIPGFDYLPGHIAFFKNYVADNRSKIFSERGFCRFLDVDRLVSLFGQCSPAQMNDIRSIFLDLYRINNVKEVFVNDLPAIEELLMGIETTWERPNVDRVQLLQYKWFAENLRKIIDSLR